MNRRHGLLVRWSAVTVAVVAGAAALPWLTAPRAEVPVRPGDRDVAGVTDRQARDRPADLPHLRLLIAGEAAGLTRAPFDGERTRSLPEDMGTGVALADFDGDGDLDMLLAGSGPLGTGGPCLLNRNEGGLQFVDVSAASLPPVRLVGMAVAAADADGDGDIDAYVTGHGRSLFLRNRGDGTFEDATEAAGLTDDGFAAGAIWGDLDGDGDLDLYVTHYVRFRDDDALRRAASSQYGRQIPAMLNPSTFPPDANRCWGNRGDGTFEEVAETWGVANPAGRGLGAAIVDLDGDGKPEIYVANDVSDNALFRNRGDGVFEDVSYPSCTADYRGAMGLAVEDFDGDGWPDLFVTHWLAQENALYHNGTGWSEGGGSPRLFFTDAAEPQGLGATALDSVGWGAVFSDLDADGRRDLLVVNGSTFERIDDPTRLVPQRPLLYWNAGGDRGFHECALEAGEAFATPRVARGLAAGDLDGDGDEDFVMTVHGGPPLVLVNDGETRGRRLVVRLRARTPDAAGRGARVSVRTEGNRQVQWVGASPSYLSTSGTDLHFGLGAAATADVEVRFASGTTVTRTAVAPGRLVVEEP